MNYHSKYPVQFSLFRQGELNFAYKKLSYSATPSDIVASTSSDGPPPKRQRTTPDLRVPDDSTSTPTPGTIRSTSVYIRHHKYSLGFFYGI